MVTPSHESLGRIDSPLWIGDRLPTGRFADDCVVLVSERDDARGQAVAFRVRDHLRLTSLHHRNHAVGRSEVDADNFFALSHRLMFSFAISFLSIWSRVDLNEQSMAKSVPFVSKSSVTAQSTPIFLEICD